MTTSNIRTKRIPIEINHLKVSFESHQIECWPLSADDLTKLEAFLPGPGETPYENGKFKVSIEFTSQYPFHPPVVKFITPIYHPNIDTAGKICLDILRMPPTGSYNPALTLESILLSIQVLLATPNPDDPLQSAAADIYKHDRDQFNKIAAEYTEKYATENSEPEAKKSRTDR